MYIYKILLATPKLLDADEVSKKINFAPSALCRRDLTYVVHKINITLYENIFLSKLLHANNVNESIRPLKKYYQKCYIILDFFLFLRSKERLTKFSFHFSLSRLVLKLHLKHGLVGRFAM